jgi:hypothetical protein
VNRTAGGRFDPADRTGLYFLASQINGAAGCATNFDHPHVLIAVDQLDAPGALDRLHALLDQGRKVLLDSGVFSFASDYGRRNGKSQAEAWATPPDVMPGFNRLWDRWVHLATTYTDRLWGYIEMDLGGMDSKRRLRAMAEAAGLQPIPVYHPLYDGWDYFDDLATTYDRIAMANFTGPNLNRSIRKRLLMTAWERHRRYPDLWLHLLGYSPNEWSPGVFAADSADSSSWVNSLRYGRLRGTSYLRAFGEIPRLTPVDADESTLAARMSSGDYHCLERNWRRIRTDLADTINLAPYPAVTQAIP